MRISIFVMMSMIAWIALVFSAISTNNLWLAGAILILAHMAAFLSIALAINAEDRLRRQFLCGFAACALGFSIMVDLRVFFVPSFLSVELIELSSRHAFEFNCVAFGLIPLWGCLGGALTMFLTPPSPTQRNPG